MKASLIIVGSLLVLGMAAHAAEEPTIKITSFQRIGNIETQLGEVCGQVKGFQTATLNLKVMADYNTHRPGEYHTFVGPSGSFCQVIRTLNGSVEVTPLQGTSGIKDSANITN